MSLRRMIPFLLINILVSTVTVLAVWSVLQRRGAVLVAPSAEPTAELAQPTQDTVAAIPTQGSGDSAESAPAIDPTPAPVEPTIAPTATPQGPVTHVVQAGDSIGALSVEYDIGMDEIMAANGLDDANTIFVGQELIIPLGQENVVEEGGGEPTPTPIPTVQVGTSAFEITSVDNVGDVAVEQVVIANIGAEAVQIAGWTISDDLGDTYTFPQLLLFGSGAAVTLHSGSGSDGGLDFYWGRDLPAWESGNVLVFRNPAGEIAAEFTVP